MAEPTPQQLAKALTLDERMAKFGFDPSLNSGTLLPFGTNQQGENEWAIPQIGYDMVKALVLPGHVAQGGQATNNDVFDMALNLAGMGGSSSMALGKAAVGGPGGKVLGANVYQGGPHRYGPEGAAKSLEHIGKGEGAQAYGWGRYDAGNPAVAAGYQRSIAGPLLDLEQPARELGLELSRNARIELGRQASLGDPLPDAARRSQYASSELRDVPADKLEKLIDLKRQSQQTYLYKHDLPDEDIARYMDWEKPLSEQPESVLKALMNLPNAHKLSPEMTGAQFYESSQLVPGEYMDQKAASEALGKSGVPGLKYLDQGSRIDSAAQQLIDAQGSREAALALSQKRLEQVSFGDTQGRKHWADMVDRLGKPQTHNYVTWDQDVLNRMKLLERNGETFGMTGNPAMLAAGQNQDASPSKMALELAKRLSDQDFYAKGGI